MNESNFVKKPVILCVDDEKFVLDTLSKQLQRRFGTSFEYELAESAEEAIEIVDELAEEGYEFIMIISDQVMPGMTGDKLLTYIHQHDPRSIKILLTGQASIESAVNVINNADLYRYLSKPWSEDDLLLTVEKGVKQFQLIEERKKQTKLFRSFFPGQFLECLGKKSDLDIHLGDHTQREMPILFLDIARFTDMSEQMTPEENFNFINLFLSYIEPAIRLYKGFIDKYIGDAVLALFHEPEDALQASLAIQHAISKFNTEQADKKFGPIKSGIGLHMGSLMLGIVGVENRLQGTVISDAVNFTSRLQGLTALYNSNIITSEYFLNKLEGNREKICTRFLGKVKVKGKSDIISVYEILDKESDINFNMRMETKESFERGVFLYLEKKFAEACVAFKAVTETCPEDTLAHLYLKSAANLMLNGVEENWKGFIATQKTGLF